jgi:DNA-binding response OmpR family regulator
MREPKQPRHDSRPAEHRSSNPSIVWINGVPHVPLRGVTQSRISRSRLRKAVAEWSRRQTEEVVLDDASNSLLWRGVSVRLTPLQYRLASCLFAARGSPVSSRELQRKLWGQQPTPNGDELVRAHVAGLRRSLRRAGLPQHLVENVWGGFYRLPISAFRDTA